MPIFGDLERFLAALYPNRIPIAIGLIVAIALVLVVGYRRGAHRAAGRHPRATGAIVAVALAVGLPLAWYVGSPLFIRTELNEEAPVGLIASPLPVSDPNATPSMSATPVPATTPVPSVEPSAGPAARPSGALPADPPRPTSATPSPAAVALRLRGTFRGADDFHTGSGTAILAQAVSGRYVLRLEDFSVRNGPDLFVYLSSDPSGYRKGALEVGRLKASDGSFNYALPVGTDVTGFRSVVIWCKQFSVQFAAARLKAE